MQNKFFCEKKKKKKRSKYKLNYLFKKKIK